MMYNINKIIIAEEKLMFNEIWNELSYRCYRKLEMKIEGVHIFHKIDKEEKRVCYCIDLTGERYIDEENFIGLKREIRNIFLQDARDNIKMLCLILTDNVDKRAGNSEKSIKEMALEMNGVWIVDTRSFDLIIYENQLVEVDDIRKAIESAIENKKINQSKTYFEKIKEQGIRKFICDKSVITWGIILVNVIVFVVLESRGSTEDVVFMANHGAGVVSYIIDGEYYRLFTEMFLHFGYEHLMNNMLVLYFIGEYVEKVAGKLGFTIIYLGSGLIASVASFVSNYYEENIVVSAGASGAVFGVIGALLGYIIFNRGRINDMTIKKVVIMIVLSLYHGFVSTGVDNVAHIVGLMFGFIIALILNLACSFRYNIIK